MPCNDLLELLKLESKEIEAAFKKASLTGHGTPQEISDAREGFVHAFISKFFPFPFRIAKGVVRDSFGLQSGSIDCLILNPCHPHTVEVTGKHSLIFCDGVDSAIEIKPDISSKAELERGLAQIEKIKILKRVTTGLLTLPGKPNDQDLKEFSKRIPSYIFSVEAKKNPIDTASEVKDYYLRNQTPIQNQVDAIVINQKGIIFNHKVLKASPFNQKTNQFETGIFYEEWKEHTLAKFLLQLNSTPGAQIKISDDVITHYLNGIKFYSITKL